LKETETSNDTTRKSEMKNIQETIKQLHGNICIFSHSIEQLTAENELNLGKKEMRLFSSSIFIYLVDTLQRHLIRSLCADMCDLIIRELDTSASAKPGQLSIEVRRININIKIIIILLFFQGTK